jgi:septal ring factor EnvC (AmiA/AmiB activator)
MEQPEKVDNFKVLEEKVEMLIEHIRSLRNEKQTLEKSLQDQERNFAILNGELENLKEIRDKTKVRIASILEKIEKLDV